jgi:hypothetical protein
MYFITKLWNTDDADNTELHKFCLTFSYNLYFFLCYYVVKNNFDAKNF